MAQVYPADRYTRYKRGTEKVVTWLVDAVRGVQKRNPITTSLTITGKLRTIILPQYAQLVSSPYADVKIPPEIISILQDVIERRSECAQYFSELSQQQAVPDKVSVQSKNTTHMYFTEVLRRVLALLKLALSLATPDTQPKASKKMQQPQASPSPPSLANIFEYLDLKEPVETTEDVITRLSQFPQLQPTVSSRNAEYQLDTADEDKVLALWCFYRDLADIRSLVDETWRACYEGTYTDFIALQVTDQAVRLSPEMYNTFATANPDLKSVEAVASFLRINTVYGDGKAYLGVSKGDTQGEEAADLLCFMAYNTATQFCAEMSRLHNGTTRPGWEAEEDRLRTPVAEALLPTLSSVYGLLSTWNRSAGQADGLGLDSITCELLEFCHHWGVPLWLPSAVEMLTSVYSAWGFKSSRSTEASVELAAYMLDDVRKHIKAAGSSHQNSPRERTAGFATLDRVLTRLTDRSSQGFKVLEVMPLLAHNNMMTARIIYHDSGTYDANIGGGVLAMAYLYRMAQSLGLINGSWADVDFVIKEQSRSGTFVRESQTLLGWARHFSLALGAEASVVSKATHNKPNLPKGRRLQERVKQLRGIARVHEGAARMSERYPEQANNGDQAGMQLVCVFLTTVAKLHDEEESRGKVLHTLRTPTELLSVYRQVLLEDEVGTNFSYFTFTRRCAALLAETKSCYGYDLASLLDSAGQGYPFEVVHAILWQAATKPETQLRETVLYRLAPMLQMLMDEAGDESLKQAQSLSSGHAPQGQRPCDLWAWGHPNAPGPISPQEADEAKRAKMAFSQTIAQYYAEVDEDTSLDHTSKMNRFRDIMTGRLKALGVPRKVDAVAQNKHGKFTVMQADAGGGIEEGWLEIYTEDTTKNFRFFIGLIGLEQKMPLVKKALAAAEDELGVKVLPLHETNPAVVVRMCHISQGGTPSDQDPCEYMHKFSTIGNFLAPHLEHISPELCNFVDGEWKIGAQPYDGDTRAGSIMPEFSFEGKLKDNAQNDEGTWGQETATSTSHNRSLEGERSAHEEIGAFDGVFGSVSRETRKKKMAAALADL